MRKWILEETDEVRCAKEGEYLLMNGRPILCTLTQSSRTYPIVKLTETTDDLIFKPGDKVRCLELPLTMREAGLVPVFDTNTTYTVKIVEDEFLWLEGIEGGWLTNRFEKVDKIDFSKKDFSSSLFNKKCGRVLRVKRGK